MTEDRGQRTDENRKVGQLSAAAFSWIAQRPALHLTSRGLKPEHWHLMIS
jgi:hypothetical protein